METESYKRHAGKKLKNLRDKDYLPSKILDLVEPVAMAQADALAQNKAVLPDGYQFPDMEQVLQGVPILPREMFPIDKDQALKLVSEFMGIVGGTSDELKEAVDTIDKDLKDGLISWEDNFTQFLKGNDPFFAEYANRTPKAPRTLSFIVQAALTPSLEKVAQSLEDRVPKDRTWQFGHCPVCGSLPFISQLKHKEGMRHATCSFCHTTYRMPRLACPYCSERDHNKLKFFQAKEEPGYRVDVCTTCNKYIKTCDFREMDKVCIPTLDDLDSITLDILAAQSGYQRPTLSAWGF